MKLSVGLAEYLVGEHVHLSEDCDFIYACDLEHISSVGEHVHLSEDCDRAIQPLANAPKPNVF